MLVKGGGKAHVIDTIFQVQGLPATLILNENSKVLYAHVGFKAGDAVGLEEEIVRLLPASRPRTALADGHILLQREVISRAEDIRF